MHAICVPSTWQPWSKCRTTSSTLRRESVFAAVKCESSERGGMAGAAPVVRRSLVRRWLGRSVLGALGAAGVLACYQASYARRIPLVREVEGVLLSEGVVPAEVSSLTGALSHFPWWHVNSLVWSWEWRPRLWVRQLLYGDDTLCHLHEAEAVAVMRFKGELRDVRVVATAHLRDAQRWRMQLLEVHVEGGPQVDLVKVPQLLLPDNMLVRSGGRY